VLWETRPNTHTLNWWPALCAPISKASFFFSSNLNRMLRRLEFAATKQDEQSAVLYGRSLPSEIGELYREASNLHWLWPCVHCEQLTGRLACFSSDRSKVSFVCAGCFPNCTVDLCRLWRKSLI
jgi:hypothetical protein